MTTTDLIRRGLRFHWRGHFAVMLGVAVGTAVLTGALLVGDSLRGSLRERAERQTGGVVAALFGDRFIRPPGDPMFTAAVLLAGTAATDSAGPVRVQVIGLTDPDGAPRVSASLAAALDLRPGQPFTIRVPKPTEVPRDTVLGIRDADDAQARVRCIDHRPMADDDPWADFTLRPGVGTVRNVVVPIDTLQRELDLGSKVNALLYRGTETLDVLDDRLRRGLTLDDWGLVVRGPSARAAALTRELDRDDDGLLQPREWTGHVAAAVAGAADADGDKVLSLEELTNFYRRRGYFQVESRRSFLEPFVEAAARRAAAATDSAIAPALVYLANAIGDGRGEIPYSVVAALDPSLPPPLGPVLAKGAPPLADDEILLADWPESPLVAEPGRPITLRYFAPESGGRYRELTATFKLRDRVPMTGPAADPDLTPEFPGITDKLSIQDWDPPFPFDNRRIRQRDEDYWDRFRGTPKAYLTLDAGQERFGSRFGRLTSIRVAPKAGSDLDAAAERFALQLLAELQPEDGGFVFQPVRDRALQASQGGTDFGGLFLGFSFFLIAAALLLVALLVRLNVERRSPEIGLLLAAGYPARAVQRLLLGEAVVVTAVGATAGLLLAVGHASLMLRLLAAMWPDREVGGFLSLHVPLATLGIGWAASFVASALAVVWALRGLNKQQPARLLAGATDEPESVRASRFGWGIAAACGLGGLALVAVATRVSGHEARAGTFFGSGALLLTGALTAFRAWLRRPGGSDKVVSSIASLGVRNAGRAPTRSLLTAGLIAAAAFLLVVVESFRRQPDADFLDRRGGSGGYALFAESDMPVFQDLNDPDTGRGELLDGLERLYQRRDGDRAADLLAAKSILESSSVESLRLRAGDDAGCRNLYAPTKPRLVGVPASLIDRGGFRFAAVAEPRDNPWSLLDAPGDDIPVFGEANTVVWALKSSLGGRLATTDAAGRARTLKIVGLLQESVFQGELVMAERRFLELFPRHEGFQMFLIDTGPKFAEARSVWQAALGERGIVVEPAAERVRAYLAVENTYLSTFQILGGFGLLLGAAGLAVVLLRAAWERRGELALLRAIGYRAAAVGRMLRAENGFLLIAGLVIGVGCAAIAVAVPVATRATAVPVNRIAFILIGVLAVGWLAGALAVRSAMTAGIVPALRRE